MRYSRVVVVSAAASLTLLSPAGAGANAFDLAERARCQRAVESVYWQSRTWPHGNPDPKPDLEAVLPAATVLRRASDAVAMSRALSELWSEPLTAAMLQREVERMAAATRRPAVLAELFAALGNDSQRVAECLARPVLAERLARERYQGDTRIHGALERRARRALAAVRTVRDLRTAGERYSEIEWVRGEGDAPAAGAVSLDAEAWRGTMASLAAALGTGAARDLAPGVVSPLADEGDRFRAFGILSMGPGRVRVAVSEWHKQPFAAWWDGQRAVFAEGASILPAEPFVLPDPLARQPCADDTWSPLPFRPYGLSDHQAVWTGAEMLVWGGANWFTIGGRYDPAIDSWHPIAVDGEPSARTGHAGHWTGTHFVVWGGWGFLSSDNVLDTGGRYDPATDTWAPTTTAGAPTRRMGHTSVWTGSRMLVWGGCTSFGCGTLLATGGSYDPAADTWTVLSTQSSASARSGATSVWTGSEMIVWGGCTSFSCSTDSSGGRYDPASDSWRPMSTANAPAGRSLHTAVWTGSQMVVWGGVRDGARLDTGGRYAPATDTWSPTTTAGAPMARRHHVAAWAPTAARMVVWGGCPDHDCSSHLGIGGRYDPVADAWTPTSLVNAPMGRSSASAVWSGTEIIIWGGCIGGECQYDVNSGGRYDPVADSWTSIGLPADPGPRLNHTAVWTGAEMIVWGGYQLGYGSVLTGRRYDPVTDTWSGMNATGYVGARDGHTAVWTGTEMIVWGGREAGIGTTITGGRYNPVTDTWIVPTYEGAPDRRAFHTAEWTGTRMVVWGGCAFEDCASYRTTGGRYDPAADAWTPTTLAGVPSPRLFHSSVWTGSSMVVWGGFDGASNLGDGARYDPSADQWTPVASSGAPSARRLHSGVWTGGRMVVWGGRDASGPLLTGARYDPAANTWTAMSTASAPAGRWRHAAVAADGRVIVWGGCTDLACDAFDIAGLTLGGGRYDVAADAWEPTSTLLAPHARTNHTAVWTGEEMIVWGGWRGSGSHITATGAAYCASGAGAPPDITVTPAEVAFGRVLLGRSADRALVVSNQGGGELVIASVTVAGTGFSIASDGCTGVPLEGGAACTVVVRFAPAFRGPATGSVTLASNDPDQASLPVALRGWGWRRRDAPATAERRVR